MEVFFMPFGKIPFLPPFSNARLPVPRHFERNLRRLLKHQPEPEKMECYPAAAVIFSNASFLYERFLSLKKELKGCSSLPAAEGIPFMLTVARDICLSLPLEKGRIMHNVRKAYTLREVTCRELDVLSPALCCALFERLSPCLEKALDPMEEEAALALQSTCEKCLHALHALARIRFDTLNEHLNPVAAVLRKEETYRHMDRESRLFYIARAAHLARKWSLSETAVARAALALAENKEGPEKEAGYYLIENPRLIACYLLKSKTLYSLRQKTLFYLLPLMLPGLLFATLWIVFKAPLFLLPFGLIAFCQGIRPWYFKALRRAFPPRMLPRLSKKYTRNQRLLVVVPTLLTGKKQALQMVSHLNTLHAATPHAHFLLLADFADNKEQWTEEDGLILRTAKAAVAALNAHVPGTFHYLHRARTWDEGQQAFCGRERKRGALEDLNLLLAGEECPDSFLYASLPVEQWNNAYDQVITLDADTFLPPGAAAQMQGALLHPLQKGRIAVISPRMENLSLHIKTRLQHLLAQSGGTDGYHRLFPEAYQDVFGRGSFAGKGIYDPHLFLHRTLGRLPKGRILSHDLIEGELAGAAYAEDIAFFDSQPAKIAGWQKRLHRWTRGDWQLLPFLFKKDLSLLSKFKIFDNLRHSLVPVCQCILLLAGALMQNPFLMLLGLPFPICGMGKRLWLLPGKAATQADAVCRSLYRQFISRKKLLSWVTAAQAENGGLPLYCIFSQLILGTGMVALSLLKGGVLVGVIPGLMWLSAPLLREYMDKEKKALPPLSEGERETVLSLCRDTWHFFEKNVHAGTAFLPPDNVQLQPEKGPAMRTSPTNMGLYLLSCLAAREMNLITTPQLIRRMLRTVETMEHLERWQGHFYNWYDLGTLSPLPPRFISTVDSGNLCACLLACAQGARRYLKEMDASARNLPARLDFLARSMQFAPLYDASVSLFHIGYDTDEKRLSPSHYDLLASECRLASYVAVMLRQVPLRHWYALGRNVTRQGGGAALLSWGGTAFEYLMPHLLLPLYDNTLLSDGCKSALRAQMSAAHGHPFGISESGYFAFDPDMNYQYRAFGLPALSVSHETAGHVVAPYASMLALPFFPKATIRNLQWMRRLSWYSEEGLYEAADYTPHRLEKAPRLVQSHMAHHQGMVLCAACNLLTEFSLVRYFMAPAPARAYAFLLCENKQPLPPFSRPLPRKISPPREHTYAFPAGSHFPYAAHALSGHHTTLLMNSRGDGFLKSGDRLWSRFSPFHPSGIRFYIRDLKTGAFIQPQIMGNMQFENGCIRIPFRAFGLEGEMRFFVLPLTGEAVMDITMENTGDDTVQVEVISYLEVTMCPWAEDAAHPNFRDLSLLIEPRGENGLICRRLTADPKEKLPVLCHSVLGQTDTLHRQGDRMLFLGREGSVHAPAQLMQNSQIPLCRTGSVITPCLSLWAGVHIPGGKRKHLQFSLKEMPWLPDTGLPNGLHGKEDFSLCRTKDQMTLNFLSLSPTNLPLYGRMLGSLCFGGQPHQAALPESIHTLWQYGISGNEPVCTVYLKKADKPLIRHVLSAHAWFETMEIKTVLLFLCEKEQEDYFTPLQDAVHAAMNTLKMGRERIYIASGNGDAARKMKTLSALYLESGLSLAAQLSTLSHAATAFIPIRQTAAQPVPFPALQYANGCGGFTKEGDYCITAPTPAPWHNILMGETFGTIVCENAILHSFCENSQMGRITEKSPDVHRPCPSEEMLLRAADGSFFSLSSGTVCHRPGVTEYASYCDTLRCTLTVFNHPSLPLGIRIITLQPEQDTQTELRCLVHFAMGSRKTGCRKENDMIFASSAENSRIAFAHLPKAQTYCLPFRFSHAQNAADCEREGGNCGMFVLPISLKARRSFSVAFLVGCTDNEADARVLAENVLSQGPGKALRQTQSFWQEKLERLLLFGGAPWLQLYMNRWLPYQTQCARLMGRTGPYQTGGAFGFRDQLQDLLCCLHTDPLFARNHILLSAAHQYREGDVQHWWHAPLTGVRTRISDDKLFLPFIAALYVQVTGDESIWQEEVPFLVSPPLKEEEHDRYETPEVSEETASLLQHCRLAIDSVSFGPHGIPLMGSGDWNDGMNKVEGESVWLGFFLCMVLEKMAVYTDREAYLARRHSLLSALENAWTGEWYLRAWYKAGEPLGGPHTRPPRIDLISQAFACLAGAPRNHARTALYHAVDRLYKKERGQVLLLHPPFAPAENAGYIGAYIPGVRENGGQYTHAVPWLVQALAHIGAYDTAWEIARALLPLFHTDTPQGLHTYKTEPYVLCGDVYAGENPGRGGWSWYTGSAAWLYYIYLTCLMGFEKRGHLLRLNPCPADDMEEFTFVYRFHSTSYHLTASRDTLFPTLDGERMQDGWIHLTDDGKTHEARFPWKRN